MIWIFFLIVAAVVTAVLAALVLGRATFDPMAPATHSRPAVQLPQNPLSADLDELHFDTALRGYRMDQGDDVLDHLKVRLAAYERTAEGTHNG